MGNDQNKPLIYAANPVHEAYNYRQATSAADVSSNDYEVVGTF